MRLIRELIKFLRRLLGRDDQPPSPATSFTYRRLDDMRIQLDWTYPVPNARQRPVAFARIEARLDPSLPWSEVNTLPSPTTRAIIDDATPGNWEFRLFILDEAGEESTPVTATAAVGFDGPSPASAFTATVVP